jgi:hypothetical protein
MTDVERTPPEIDYLAKDYASFRRLMLDHLSVLVPGWTDQDPADLGDVLVDVLAYAADYLSYYQDAVASEAYLGTARLRRSVRRHARLLDYDLHEGCNARAWVQVQVDAEVRLPQGTQLLTRLDRGDKPVIKPGSATYRQALLQDPTVFETLHDARLLPAHNGIPFYQKDNADYLPKGSTEACLKDWFDEHSQTRALDGLEVGDVLIFEEMRNPRTGLSAGANPAHRHAVRLTRITRFLPATKLRQPGKPAQTTERPGPPEPYVEIEWAAADALPFALCIAPYFDGRREYNISVARGNILLVDHGRTIRDEELPAVRPHARYRPHLRFPGLTYTVPYDHGQAQTQPASAATQYGPHEAAGWVRLRQHASRAALGEKGQKPLYRVAEEDGATIRVPGHAWTLRHDLLSSGPFDRDYLVEMEEDGREYLRFGFGGMGRQPVPGERFVATYRVGNGTRGNVGADTIAHVVTHEPAITRVRSPLPARGGRNPERIQAARLHAPHAFRTQERCVTEADYAAVAARHPAVVRAVAHMRWIGSGHTASIYVQRAHGQPVDDDFRREMRAFMEPCRTMGYDIQIRAPRFVPLQIGLVVYLQPQAHALTVHRQLKRAFGDTTSPDGDAGFFYPDDLGFGQSVHHSQVIARAMAVAGVERVEVVRFRRADGDRDVLEIPIGPTEIARLGRIDFYFEGGL